MRNLILNIGLNVGLVQPDEQLELTVNEVREPFPKSEYKVVESSGDWGKENTAVFKIELDKYMSAENFPLIMQYFCTVMNQDAIAYKVNGVGYMAFNVDYEGERFKFNNEYFVDYE